MEAGRHSWVGFEMGAVVAEERMHYIVVEQAAVGQLKVLRHCRDRLGSRGMRCKQNLVVGQPGNHKRR